MDQTPTYLFSAHSSTSSSHTRPYQPGKQMHISREGSAHTPWFWHNSIEQSKDMREIWPSVSPSEASWFERDNVDGGEVDEGWWRDNAWPTASIVEVAGVACVATGRHTNFDEENWQLKIKYRIREYFKYQWSYNWNVQFLLNLTRYRQPIYCQRFKLQLIRNIKYHKQQTFWFFKPFQMRGML